MGTATARCDYPLTAMQRAMVLASLRIPGSGAYVLQRICECPAGLNVARLQRAWDRVIERHAALRCRVEGGPADSFSLRVENAPEIRWQCDPPANLADFLREDRKLGFRLEDGIPMRFALWESPHGTTLLWTVHHVLLDGRSVALVWRELFAVYDGLLKGEEVALPEARDFRAHLDWLAARDFTPSELYWRRQWEGVANTVGYVADRLRSAAPPAEEAFAKEIRQADGEFTRRVAQFAAGLGVTINSLVLGAWALLLSRYSGRDDVVLGVTRHCRHTSVPDAPAMIGPLMNTLPFRVRVAPDRPLAAWLRQIRSQWVELREHEQTPLDLVRAWSSLPPGMPPFESVVVYDHEPLEESLRSLGGEWENRRFRGQERTDSAMTLVAWGRPALTLQIVYDTGQFCRETVAGMLGHLEALLRGFVEHPDSRLGAIHMLSASEEARLTVDWNVQRRSPQAGETACATEASPMPAMVGQAPACRAVHQLFEEQARRVPEKVALEGDSVWPYAEANRQANQLACLLRERGVGPEDLVAIKLPSSPEAVVAILAVLKAGGAFLPLDPSLPAERLAGMMERAAPKIVLDDWPRLREQMASQAVVDLPPAGSADNAAYAIYTSGSTGTPKAVVVTHRSLVNHTVAACRAQEIGERDRRLQFASMGSDVFVAEIFNNLASGATLVFGRQQAAGAMAEFLRFLEEQRITVTGMPSTWWHEWVATMTAGNATLPTSLRVVNTGMERVDATAYRNWRRLVGNRVRWFNVYGPTETTITSLCYEAGSSAWEGGSFVPIGRPIDNLRAYALDGEGRLAPVGIPGELFIGGVGVARGFYPTLSAQTRLPGFTVPATWCSPSPTGTSFSWAEWTGRSKSADSAWIWRKWKRRWGSTPRCVIVL
jgi:amino acid adenylation domain-containing protein